MLKKLTFGYFQMETLIDKLPLHRYLIICRSNDWDSVSNYDCFAEEVLDNLTQEVDDCLSGKGDVLGKKSKHTVGCEEDRFQVCLDVNERWADVILATLIKLIRSLVFVAEDKELRFEEITAEEIKEDLSRVMNLDDYLTQTYYLYYQPPLERIAVTSMFVQQVEGHLEVSKMPSEFKMEEYEEWQGSKLVKAEKKEKRIVIYQKDESDQDGDSDDEVISHIEYHPSVNTCSPEDLNRIFDQMIREGEVSTAFDNAYQIIFGMKGKALLKDFLENEKPEIFSMGYFFIFANERNLNVITPDFCRKCGFQINQPMYGPFTFSDPAEITLLDYFLATQNLEMVKRIIKNFEIIPDKHSTWRYLLSGYDDQTVYGENFIELGELLEKYGFPLVFDTTPEALETYRQAATTPKNKDYLERVLKKV